MSAHAHQAEIELPSTFIRIPISAFGSTQMIDMGWSDPDENGDRWGIWRFIKKDYYGNVISDKTEQGGVGFRVEEPPSFWQRIFG